MKNTTFIASVVAAAAGGVGGLLAIAVLSTLLGAGFLLVFLVSWSGGFHGARKSSVFGTLIDAVEALAFDLDVMVEFESDEAE